MNVYICTHACIHKYIYIYKLIQARREASKGIFLSLAFSLSRVLSLSPLSHVLCSLSLLLSLSLFTISLSHTLSRSLSLSFTSVYMYINTYKAGGRPREASQRVCVHSYILTCIHVHIYFHMHACIYIFILTYMSTHTNLEGGVERHHNAFALPHSCCWPCWCLRVWMRGCVDEFESEKETQRGSMCVCVCVCVCICMFPIYVHIHV